MGLEEEGGELSEGCVLKGEPGLHIALREPRGAELGKDGSGSLEADKDRSVRLNRSKPMRVETKNHRGRHEASRTQGSGCSRGCHGI